MELLQFFRLSLDGTVGKAIESQVVSSNPGDEIVVCIVFGIFDKTMGERAFLSLVLYRSLGGRDVSLDYFCGN